jgi:hypothetical protein
MESDTFNELLTAIIAAAEGWPEVRVDSNIQIYDIFSHASKKNGF